MAKDLRDYRREIKTALSAGDLATEVLDPEIDRAVELASNVLSRYFPREQVAQTVYNEDITSEAWTAILDTEVTLANKPIRFASETVVQSSVTMTRDTDYEMDYVNGGITAITGGAIIAAAATITYKLDGTMLDISSLLTEPIAIDRVDILNHDQVPVVFEGWITHGDFLILTGSGLDTQQRLVDNDHIRIYYMAQHTEPTDTASGSFPDYLDEVVEVGASGYVLVSEAIQQDHLAVVDIANARLELADVATIQTAIATALSAAGTRISSAATDLASAIAEIALANADQDKVNTASTGPIAAATTEIALVITLLGTGGLPATALAKITTHVGEAGTSLALVNTELILGNTALDKIDGELISNTRNADAYLNTGDDLINSVNVGRNAAQLNQAYALAKTEIAGGFAQEASQRFQHGQVLTQEAAQRNNMALQFVNETNGLLRQAEAKLNLVQQRLAVGTLHQRNAEGYNTNAQRYIQAANAHIQAASLYVREMEVKVSEINAVTTATNAHLAMAVTQRQMAEQFRVEANARISDFINTLRDRSQINERPRASSVRGYSSDQQSNRRFIAWERQGTF